MFPNRESLMGRKREVLSLLNREELQSLVGKYDLDVADRRVKDNLVEALARSKKAKLSEILETLPRDTLKEISRTFDLDDSGREKSVLIERIISGDGEPARQRNGLEPLQMEIPTSRKLTVDALEGYLWSAADILRGSIDSSDYKNYIFGMLFLKRLSDVFEEEAEKLIAQGESKDVAWNDPDEHRFFVPKRARWTTLQKTATNIGEALNKACMALEEQNPSLEGVLAGIDYNDEHKLGDAKNRDTVLARLVQHFSQLSLRNKHLSEPDMLGRAYEYLIEKFADDAGKKGGEFYTPRMVVKLIVFIAGGSRCRFDGGGPSDLSTSNSH